MFDSFHNPVLYVGNYQVTAITINMDYERDRLGKKEMKDKKTIASRNTRQYYM